MEQSPLLNCDDVCATAGKYHTGLHYPDTASFLLNGTCLNCPEILLNAVTDRGAVSIFHHKTSAAYKI